MQNFNGNYEEKSLKNLVSQLDMIVYQFHN
jgi:hypothetical protein